VKKKPLPQRVRDQVQERDGLRCVRCGMSLVIQPRHVHHRLPRSGGGEHVLSNLILLCAKCHATVHNSPRQAREDGYIVSRYADSASRVPLWYAQAHQVSVRSRVGWHVIGDDGQLAAWRKT